ncbi:peptidase M50 [Gloeomargarita lithophora Alchichica-D10]|uniref:Peptidase M50 n=1 Tax=Gloeomargarita lithophora Alchichica-D10 TaxID=1188229 RepID=A0A1J0AG53_9CYAN|nr:site-2 protease family protein [Gloeomargarita lithophora]APB34922.1 peptidase M50 [Gloeomargarita lithophora Alchichica-D10]
MEYKWEPAVLTGGVLLVLMGGWWRLQMLSLDRRLAWGQWFLLALPWGLWLGLIGLGIAVNFTVILWMLVMTQLGYVALGRWRRGLPVPVVLDVTPTEAAGTPFLGLAALRELFGWEHFFATELRPYRGGAIVVGNLRGNPAQVHRELTAKLQNRFGDEAYRLFLVADGQGRPTVVILPTAEVETEPVPWWRGLSLGLLGFTLLTCWQIAPPWGLLMGLVLLAHEGGHRWQAGRYGVRLLWPLWVPTAELGAFGGITRFATAVPHRTALWDIAAAGPGVGALVSGMLLLVGLGLSPTGDGVPVEPEWLQTSLLVGGLARLVLGAELQEPLVRLHPLVTVGWAGLVVTALNFLPVGCLDGGRMVQAVYGEKVLRATTLVTLVVLGCLGLGQPVLLSWGVLILFIQRRPERPNLEDITEPDDRRAFLTLGVLLLTLLVLLPWQAGLWGALGWGG